MVLRLCRWKVLATMAATTEGLSEHAKWSQNSQTGEQHQTTVLSITDPTSNKSALMLVFFVIETDKG